MKKLPILWAIVVLIMMTKTTIAQIAINNTGSNADPSAVLDISATDKGLLIPRVTLNNMDDNLSPVENPATGLMVYNIGTTGQGPGFYVWNGAYWSALVTMDQVQNILMSPESQPVLAEIYEYNEIGSFSTLPVPVAGEYVQWTTASQGNISGMVFNGSALNATDEGYYNVKFDATLQLPTPVNGKTVDVALFVNDVRQDNLHARIYIKEAGKSQNISFSGITSLSQDDALAIEFTMDDDGILRLETANLNLSKVN